MKTFTRFFTLMLVLLTMMVGNAQAKLLDFGPIVPEVIGSTPPNLKTGYPAWFRDTNRVPLQLCLEEVPGCLFAAADRPDLTQPLAFPNLPDELFYYSATALIPNAINEHLLFAGIEMNLVDNGDGTYGQVGFARVRIRIDTTVAGDYIVTTPWKQYFFTVSQAAIDDTGDGRRVINATEDIGLGPDGEFAGVLKGNVGPFVYSQGAPFVTATGSYLGDNTERTVVGSTFPDPGNPGQMANIFRIQGPAGFTTVSTNQFAITGKLYLDPIPTPLTVDKVTYARNGAGTEKQVNVFATTQANSNQTNPLLAFPLNFALTGIASDLAISGTDIPTQNLTTNNAADGKFYAASGILTGNDLPGTITVTNGTDTPDTAVTVPLVDEVLIGKAVYLQQTGTLVIAASSYDKLALPALQAFMPGMAAPLGTLVNDQLSVSFPYTDSSVNGSKTYAIPPATITVKSEKGGTATASVITLAPPLDPVTGVSVTTDKPSPQLTGSSIVFSASATGGIGTYEYRFELFDGNAWSTVRNFSSANTWAWSGASPGSYVIKVTAKNAGSADEQGAASTQEAYVISPPPPAASGVSLFHDKGSPQPEGTTVNFSATGAGGSGSYEFQYSLFSSNAWSVARPYSTNPVWSWSPVTPGTYAVVVAVRNAGTTVDQDAASSQLVYTITSPPPAAGGVNLFQDKSSPQPEGTTISFSAAGSGGSGTYEYRYSFFDGNSWSVVRPYSTNPTWTWTPGTAGTYAIVVSVRNAGSAVDQDAASSQLLYTITPPAQPVGNVGSVSIFQDKGTPQQAQTAITFAASASGGSGGYEYRYSLFSNGSWSVVRPYSTTPTWTWTPQDAGTYAIAVDARNAGSVSDSEAKATTVYVITTQSPASGASLFFDKAGPQPAGATITFAAATGGTGGPYEYRYLLFDGNSWTVQRPYSTTTTWNWTPDTAGSYLVAVEIRTVGSVSDSESQAIAPYTIDPAP